MKEKLITGLDIGTSHIRLVVGQINPHDNGFNILAAVQVPSSGVSKGMVVSIEEVVSSITSALEQIERIVGQPIHKVYVGISGTHITTMSSKGVIAVSRADNEISESDVERVIEAAQTVAMPPNYEVLHVIPKIFSVDNQIGIKDPVGMTGIRLECETQIIQGLSAQIKNLTKAIYRTGLEIEDLVLAILANAECCVSKRQKELGCVLINIGHSTTSMAVFEEGDILSTYILPVGASHVTNDIALGLRTSLEIAEEIKLTYGQSMSKNINCKEEINLSEFDDKENESIQLRYVTEIIEARLQEIFDMVDKQLVEIERSGLLPAGIILTGSGAKLSGIIDLAKRELRLPAVLGMPNGIKTVIDKVNDLSYTTAIGLAVWGYEMEKQHGVSSKFEFKISDFKNINLRSLKSLYSKIKGWIKRLVP